MDFLCCMRQGCQPRICPVEPTRDWTDATPEVFAYRWQHKVRYWAGGGMAAFVGKRAKSCPLPRACR